MTHSHSSPSLFHQTTKPNLPLPPHLPTHTLMHAHTHTHIEAYMHMNSYHTNHLHPHWSIQAHEHISHKPPTPTLKHTCTWTHITQNPTCIHIEAYMHMNTYHTKSHMYPHWSIHAHEHISHKIPHPHWSVHAHEHISHKAHLVFCVVQQMRPSVTQRGQTVLPKQRSIKDFCDYQIHSVKARSSYIIKDFLHHLFQ